MAKKYTLAEAIHALDDDMGQLAEMVERLCVRVKKLEREIEAERRLRLAMKR